MNHNEHVAAFLRYFGKAVKKTGKYAFLLAKQKNRNKLEKTSCSAELAGVYQNHRTAIFFRKKRREGGGFAGKISGSVFSGGLQIKKEKETQHVA